MSHEELAENIEKWSKQTQILVSIKTVKYLVRSGRLSYSKGMIGKILGVNPIISMDEEGKASTFGKSFNERGSMKLIMQRYQSMLKEGKAWGYAITHIRNQAAADWYAQQMEALTGMKPRFINDASPVLGVNGGTGTTVVSLLME
ncbi:MAG TPA: DegV family protein, partial [Bacteroidales bacterium]|nr:DegV family protein [Bacteroidales bacterium]